MNARGVLPTLDKEQAAPHNSVPGEVTPMRWRATYGDILMVPADVLVCSANVHLNLSGGVGGELLRRYGPGMQQELHTYLARAAARHVPPSTVVRTPSHGAPFGAVLHAVAINALYETSVELVRCTVDTALRMAGEGGVRSVALAALGTGYGRLPMVDFAQAIAALVHTPYAAVEEVVVCVPNEEDAQVIKLKMCERPPRA